MKKNILLLAFGLLVGQAIFGSAVLMAQTKKEVDEAKHNQMVALISARRYRLKITDALGARNTSGTVEGSLEIMDTLAVSNLPYFGKLTTTVTDPAKRGLNFESPAYNYAASLLHDGSVKILYNAKRDLEVFIYYIEITRKGKVSLTVRSNQRTMASYEGEFDFK